MKEDNLTLEEALALSIEKWEMVVENDGIESDETEEQFDHLRDNCGLCEFYRSSWGGAAECESCDLAIANSGLICFNSKSYYKQWLTAGESGKLKHAKALLKTLKSIKL